MSRRLAEATSRFLARRSPRRGFLSKTAVVGSAMAVAPRKFMLEPGTAYAQVCNCSGSRCGCGQLCCDGYTEFCCTIYGTNGCPPGSLYGGWWRVSGSSYCGGSNRYYLDCHNRCGSCGCGASGVCGGGCNGTSCGCALGSCRNRKAGCTHFRYGQCNRHIKCLGPIICRVVTCTPPWRLEPNCTTSSRTDEATRWHNRPCLTEVSSPPVGSLDLVDGQPGTIRVRGWAIDPDTRKSIDVNVFVNGSLITSVAANAPRPDVGAAYRGFGDNHGFDVTIDSTTGTKEVCVYAVNRRGGNNPLLGCEVVRVSLAAPTGTLERVRATSTARAVRVSGWAMRPGARKPVDVDVLVDGEVAATVTADRRRADLRATLGAAGLRHGFSARVPVPEGVSRICAEARHPKTGEAIRLGCLTSDTAVTEPPFGALDRIRGGNGRIRVTGWALDPDGGHAEVMVLIDGREVTRRVADEFRPDVAAIHRGATDAGGFDFRVDAAPGKHQVCVYAIGSDGRDGPLLGCGEASVQ